MKFLLIVQGEGGGHFTQAVTLGDVLLRNGHEVVEVPARRSSSRTLSDSFNRDVQVPVKRFTNPNFLPTAEDRRANLKKSSVHSLVYTPEYSRDMCYTDQRIKETGARVVINFYELLTGLTYALFRPSVPYVYVGHRHLLLHESFKFPRKPMIQLSILRFSTRLTSPRANRWLALPFHKMNPDRTEGITVIPPLLRREVIVIRPEQGDYIYGYVVSPGFADSVEAFHVLHPEAPIHFLWDKQDVDEVIKVDVTLGFRQIDDVKFLSRMASCRVYASTAGFESTCEVMCPRKPVLMVPVHIEQGCSAYDAYRSGTGIISESSNLRSLLRFAETYIPDKKFIRRARSGGRQIVGELE